MVRTGEWLSEASRVFTDSIGTHIVLALIVGFGSTLSLGILAGPLICGWYYIVLRQLREQEYRPEIGDIGKGFEVFGHSLLATIAIGAGIGVLYVVFLAIWMILCFLPYVGWLLMLPFIPIALAVGIAYATLILFVFPLIMDKRLAFWDAITQSFQKVASDFWGFLGFAALVSLINMAAAVVGGVGTLLTGPIVLIAKALAYRDNFEFGGEQVLDVDIGAGGPSAAPAPPPPPAPQ